METALIILLMTAVTVVLDLVFIVGFRAGNRASAAHFERFLDIYENGFRTNNELGTPLIDQDDLDMLFRDWSDDP